MQSVQSTRGTEPLARCAVSTGAAKLRQIKSFGCVSNELKVERPSGKVSFAKPLRRAPHDFQLTRNYTRHSQGF